MSDSNSRHHKHHNTSETSRLKKENDNLTSKVIAKSISLRDKEKTISKLKDKLGEIERERLILSSRIKNTQQLGVHEDRIENFECEKVSSNVNRDLVAIILLKLKKTMDKKENELKITKENLRSLQLDHDSLKEIHKKKTTGFRERIEMLEKQNIRLSDLSDLYEEEVETGNHRCLKLQGKMESCCAQYRNELADRDLKIQKLKGTLLNLKTQSKIQSRKNNVELKKMRDEIQRLKSELCQIKGKE